MSFLSTLFLGLIQGLSEFPPISSTGVLSLFQSIFHIGEHDFFLDVMLHLGTMLSVLICFRAECAECALGMAAVLNGRGNMQARSNSLNTYKRFAMLVIIGSIPMLPVVFIIGKLETISSFTLVVAALFLLNGLCIFVCDKYAYARKTENKVSIGDALIVGICQAFSAVPGLSRSGMTISAALLRGTQRSFALKYSYVLSVPVTFCALLISLFKAVQNGIDSTQIPAYFLSCLIAAIVGVFGIRFTKWVVLKGSWGSFAYLCWGIGLLSMILSLVS